MESLLAKVFRIIKIQVLLSTSYVHSPNFNIQIFVERHWVIISLMMTVSDGTYLANKTINNNEVLKNSDSFTLPNPPSGQRCCNSTIWSVTQTLTLLFLQQNDYIACSILQLLLTGKYVESVDTRATLKFEILIIKFKYTRWT